MKEEGQKNNDLHIKLYNISALAGNITCWGVCTQLRIAHKISFRSEEC